VVSFWGRRLLQLFDLREAAMYRRLLCELAISTNLEHAACVPGTMTGHAKL
jgi:hypothetical protein